jgi:hypothetical protein
LWASTDPCAGSIPVAGTIAIAEAHMHGTSVAVQPDDDNRCLREIQVLVGDVLWRSRRHATERCSKPRSRTPTETEHAWRKTG